MLIALRLKLFIPENARNWVKSLISGKPSNWLLGDWYKLKSGWTRYAYIPSWSHPLNHEHYLLGMFYIMYGNLPTKINFVISMNMMQIMLIDKGLKYVLEIRWGINWSNLPM